MTIAPSHPRKSRATTISLFVLIFVVGGYLPGHAQERCGTVPYQKMLADQRTVRESKRQFEEWLQEKSQNRTKTFDTRQKKNATYQIPVVVHVIHNGEPVGSGTNIPDAQVLSQIGILNEDFKRLNGDATNTPAEFVPVAGQIDVAFVLAKQTPDGLPTNGIVRVRGTKSAWELNDNYELKSLSYWPAEDYLNIWVTNLNTSFVGFAQFPLSNLPGLENASVNRLTDGVVVHYRAFGSAADGPFDLDNSYDLGRTTTHEIGHYLGLRHIWGDEDPNGSCTATDYVDDTPSQENSTSGCPSGPRSSCGSVDMYMNYLDYTDDACMNLFTQGQVARMEIVLNNSPRRVSLLNSPGLSDPLPVANDAGITSIVSPGTAVCTSSIQPQITISNTGNNVVTSVLAQVSDQNGVLSTEGFNVNLSPGQATTVTFPVALFSPGPHTVTFEILETNSVADGNPGNNVRVSTFQVPFTTAVPFVEDFEPLPVSWIIGNPDGVITWQQVTAPLNMAGNQALKMNFYDYEDSQGEIDVVYTPVFDLSAVPSAYTSFDVAYAPFQNFRDGLRVYVLTGCNSALFDGNLVYEKFGNTLATAPATSAPFVPTGVAEWRREIVNLSAYAGESNVQLAFVGVNDWGNNLYLDNIAVVTDAEEDLLLKSVERPTAVRCGSDVIPELQVVNAGIAGIQNFTVLLSVDNGPAQSTLVEGNLAPGEEKTIFLPELSLDPGEHVLSFVLTEPNGLIDVDPSNNALTVVTNINDARTLIPLRENFDAALAPEWTLVNPVDTDIFTTAATNFNQSVLYAAFDNEATAGPSWLASPVLDLGTTPEASLFFDLSYAFTPGAEERLRILGSSDCGQHYDVVLFDEAAEALATTQGAGAWLPTTTADWRRVFVNLNALAGNPEARVAFVVSGAGGNNLYLDNLEFFTSDDPDPVNINSLFLLYGSEPSAPGQFYLTFNLPEPGPVGYEVLDVMGRSLARATLENVLNQTYLIDAGNVAAGIYLVRLQIGGDYFVSRVFLN